MILIYAAFTRTHLQWVCAISPPALHAAPAAPLLCLHHCTAPPHRLPAPLPHHCHLHTAHTPPHTATHLHTTHRTHHRTLLLPTHPAHHTLGSFGSIACSSPSTWVLKHVTLLMPYTHFVHLLHTTFYTFVTGPPRSRLRITHTRYLVSITSAFRWFPTPLLPCRHGHRAEYSILAFLLRTVHFTHGCPA